MDCTIPDSCFSVASRRLFNPIVLAAASHWARLLAYSPVSISCFTLEFVTKTTTLGSVSGTRRLSKDLSQKKDKYMNIGFAEPWNHEILVLNTYAQNPPLSAHADVSSGARSCAGSIILYRDQKVSEYDQEIPQSHTEDQPSAPMH